VESRDGRQTSAAACRRKGKIRKEIDDEEISAEAGALSIYDGWPQALIQDSRGKKTDAALGSKRRLRTMGDLPIVCTLQPGELNARATQLLPGVAAAANARDAIENGFRFEFEPDGEVLASIVRMIDAERQCCQFLRFQLTVEAAGGPVVLEVTGPPGAQEFLSAMLTRV
jgi:hypothetical protein